MQKTLFIASLLIIATLAFSGDHEDLSALWKYWKVQHNKNYALAEETDRFAIFIANFRKIVKYNSEHESVKLGLNQFADLTLEEFKNKHSGCGYAEDNEDFVEANMLEYNEDPNAKLPASVDWRQHGAVTPVNDQQQCGSCWAFAAMDSLAGLLAIKHGKLYSFSAQQIIDCDTTDDGCCGGNVFTALEYTASNGLETESDYPYKGIDGTCSYKKSAAIKTNTDYKFVTPKNSNALKTALVSMPVTVDVQAAQEVFQFYTSGVITAKDNCEATIDHVALAVGYDTIQGQEAFIVKNSWGTTWGDAGYVYISTDGSANSGVGVCGILYQPTIPQ